MKTILLVLTLLFSTASFAAEAPPEKPLTDRELTLLSELVETQIQLTQTQLQQLLRQKADVKAEQDKRKAAEKK